MTGEITLRGNVLPVGGIKEKTLAAHRAGIKHVFMPEQNAKDLVDVPQEIRDAMVITLIKRVEEVVDEALEPAPAEATPPRRPPPSPAQAPAAV